MPGFPGSVPPFGAAPAPGYSAPGASTNGLAIASLILSILTLFGLGSILGIIFGFVSRAQVKRSNGNQKGAGLALAGIIVGFVTLTLALAAIAIPTFLGVKASTASIVYLPPSPIALGSLEEGGQMGQVPWTSGSQPVDTTLAAVPGGVEMSIARPDQAEWAGLPLAQPPDQSMQLSASVAIVAGPLSNGIGLGCITPSRSEQFAFLIHPSGLWEVLWYSSSSAATIIDSGATPAIHGSGSNSLTIACDEDPARPGRTEVAFEINGTPVTNDVVNVESTVWDPTIQLCSCSGSDTGRYLNAAYYTTTDPPSASSP
ncbi:MAG: DUF4190 domain-containing protein, partial [Acidimicrobiales bacterium]